jgi:hypothetical protein
VKSPGVPCAACAVVFTLHNDIKSDLCARSSATRKKRTMALHSQPFRSFASAAVASPSKRASDADCLPMPPCEKPLQSDK